MVVTRVSLPDVRLVDLVHQSVKCPVHLSILHPEKVVGRIVRLIEVHVMKHVVPRHVSSTVLPFTRKTMSVVPSITIDLSDLSVTVKVVFAPVRLRDRDLSVQWHEALTDDELVGTFVRAVTKHERVVLCALDDRVVVESHFIELSDVLRLPCSLHPSWDDLLG